ncbi:MAG: FG-GAP repeat protein [Deltaproteobacteria bacterium]|nr:FG-GAP repeat protein [Deltaproteobacteria bacterium]
MLRLPQGRNLGAWAAAGESSWAGGDAEGVGWSLAAAADQVVLAFPESQSLGLLQEGLSLDRRATDLHGESFGAGLALGDAEADGRMDLVIGVPGRDNGRGRVRLVRAATRRPDWSKLSMDLEVLGAGSGGRFGEAVALCGDLTGDGLPEWAVSAPRLSASEGATVGVASLAGGVAVLLSEGLRGQSGTVTADAVGLWLWGSKEGEGAGAALSCDRDLTGDGVADLLVGAPLGGEAAEGIVYLVSGAALGAEPTSGPLASRGEVVWRGAAAGDWAGAALAAGDVDGDGRSDVVIGAPGASGGRGLGVVFFGVAAAGWERPGSRVRLASTASGAPHLGALLGLEDLDGDGRSDLLVGLPRWQEAGDTHAGRLAVWYGGASWPLLLTAGDGSEDWSLTGQHAYEEIGAAWAVSDLGDEGEGALVLTRRQERR